MSENILNLNENNYIYYDYKMNITTNPYDKMTCGVGYFGKGVFDSKNKIGRYTIYQKWVSMIKRCYDKKYINKHHTYIDCIVCDEWLNYQNFAKWVIDNYYEVDNEEMNVDKDILHKGNKIYSPENCIFVPHRINVLFIKSDRKRGNYPIGVDFNKARGKYRARCGTFVNGKAVSVQLGYYSNPIKAFNAYKNFKENYIKEVANEYKNKIPQKLYDAMYRYEVEITD